MIRLDLLTQFRALPQNKGMVLLGGQLLLPAYVRIGEMPPFRPKVSLWLERQGRAIVAADAMTREEDCVVDKLLECLISSDKSLPKLKGRPEKMIVLTAEEADYLQRVLCLPDTTIVVEPRVLEDLMTPVVMMAEELGGRPVQAGVCCGQGVTESDFRQYAIAADEYYRAQPWRLLDSDGLIEVSHPIAPRGFKCASVMGNAGVKRGVSFFASRQAFLKFLQVVDVDGARRAFKSGLWALTYGPLADMPILDGDMLVLGNLPVADDQAYPWLHGMLTKNDPDPPVATVHYVTGLLQALARMTPEQIHNRHAQISVDVAGQNVNYVLDGPLP